MDGTMDTVGTSVSKNASDKMRKMSRGFVLSRRKGSMLSLKVMAVVFGMANSGRIMMIVMTGTAAYSSTDRPACRDGWGHILWWYRGCELGGLMV